MAEPRQAAPGLAAFYNDCMGPRGFRIAPHHLPFCMGLEDNRISNVLFLGPPGTGKSTLLCTIFAAHQIGLDPTMTVLSVSAGEALPQTFMHAVMEIIQESPAFRLRFPRVRPDPGSGWSLSNGLFVTGRNAGDENASYRSVGLSSKKITGLHARLLIFDDLHDEENSATPEGRMQVVDTYYRNLTGRGDPRGYRIIAAGRRWAADDIYQEWLDSGDWVVLSLPAARPGQQALWYDVTVPKGLACVYTERLAPLPDQDPDAPHVRYRAYYGIDPLGEGFYWPTSPAKRQEYLAVSRRRPLIARITYNGDTSAAADSVFRREDFVAYAPPAGLQYGLASPDVEHWLAARPDGIVTDAWDTAMGQIQSESRTAALVGLLLPCREWHCGEDPLIWGACDFHYDVYLMHLMVDNIDFRQLMGALRSRYGTWHPREVIVEDKVSGTSLLQTFKGSHIPLRGQKVPEGKIERATRAVAGSVGRQLGIGGGAASVQGWARMHRILYPAGETWVPDFLGKVLSVSGGTKVPDEFDALVHLVTRAITRSRRVGLMPSAAGTLMVPAGPAADDRRLQALQAVGELDAQRQDRAAQLELTPFRGLCMGGCWAFANDPANGRRQWCRQHNRPTTALDGCGDWSATMPASPRPGHEELVDV